MKRKLQIAALLTFVAILFVAMFEGPRGILAEVEESKSADRQAENRLPEILDQHHDRIGIGQRLTFGLEVIDEEGDPIRIELAEKPKTAKFNQNTLTVDWTPQMGDGANGKFVIKVTELPLAESQEPRIVTRTYNFKIQKEPVKLLELPVTSLEVDALVSIIDPERLAQSDRKWNIVSLLQRVAEIEAEKQIKPGSGISPSSGKELFRDMLRELSIMHKNPALDPDKDKYDRVWDAENWKLIAVRPRINKKVFELRLVYFNIAAAEQVYMMPRMRIVRGDDADRAEETRQKNNKVFAQMFYDAFFENGEMKDFVKSDKLKYGQALEKFITRVLTYNDPKDPLMRANFAALPHNSRLGGGNVYDKGGKYLYGDGWALGAMLVRPSDRNGKKVLTIVSPPIAGFVASIKPSKDGEKYITTKAPVTDSNNPSYKQGWEAINDLAHGTVFIPETVPDGTISKSNIDTTVNARDYKFKYMVAETPLRDPRRRLFEEKGMTCIQCHVRNFDEGDYLTSIQKPKDDVTKAATRTIPRVFFIIIPTLHSGRNEYIHREEQEQIGNLQGVFRDYLGINVRMNSPLALDWVHSTKNGRS